MYLTLPWHVERLFLCFDSVMPRSQWSNLTFILRLTRKGEENTGIIGSTKDAIHKVETYEDFYIHNNLRRINSSTCTIFRLTVLKIFVVIVLFLNNN